MAKEGEARSAVVERFFEGYVLEGQDVGDHDVLAALASEAGLDRTEVAERLGRDDDRERVAGFPNSSLGRVHCIARPPPPRRLLLRPWGRSSAPFRYARR
ncbi:MAG: hypothetical protein DRH23_07760 [Deltaproteobacteria bacterium]|nr:DsbA family protein [Deltaproteobacteria bacterium]MBW2224285.1 DsbA family protein [Deltaproteobacteria bacterium]MBW2402803.1 DsbA family protein [Deltaproteobacteria bacterium]MBW2547023.1 DsbA family protein [Deltaproteobacteria bacterium]MBW2718321.1 DsbA family protein [Deltaproteobacteria bacterium]